MTLFSKQWGPALLAFSLVLIAGTVVYAGPSLPNTFTAGTVARAGEVNANFQTVADEFDNYPRVLVSKTFSGGSIVHRVDSTPQPIQDRNVTFTKQRDSTVLRVQWSEGVRLITSGGHPVLTGYALTLDGTEPPGVFRLIANNEFDRPSFFYSVLVSNVVAGAHTLQMRSRFISGLPFVDVEFNDAGFGYISVEELPPQ